MSHRKTLGRVVLSRGEWDAHLAEDERVRRRVAELEAKLATQERRAPPPPSWVKANVEKPPEEERKKRGAKFGHAPHFRPPPEKVHETRDALLDDCPHCGGELEGPFAWDEHLVESVIPGHVRVTRYRIARYRCRSCKKVRRAHVPPDVAPDRSRFSWSTHFLVGYWSLEALLNSVNTYRGPIFLHCSRFRYSHRTVVNFGSRALEVCSGAWSQPLRGALKLPVPKEQLLILSAASLLRVRSEPAK